MSKKDQDQDQNQDKQTLLGIAFADQALMAAQIALFAGKTGKPQETIELLHDITDEISNRYQLSGVAKETMKLRINKTVSLASAIIGNKADAANTPNPDSKPRSDVH